MPDICVDAIIWEFISTLNPLVIFDHCDRACLTETDAAKLRDLGDISEALGHTYRRSITTTQRKHAGSSKLIKIYTYSTLSDSVQCFVSASLYDAVN